MTPEQQAAFIQAQATGALIEALAMFSHNMIGIMSGGSTRDPNFRFFGPSEFDDLQRKYVIGHNDVLSIFQG